MTGITHDVNQLVGGCSGVRSRAVKVGKIKGRHEGVLIKWMK